MSLVYHGTAIHNLDRLLRPWTENWSVLYVTDSIERAARYANAQATRGVDPAASTVREHAAIVTIETDQEPRWLRRQNPTSLDECEAIIETGRIVSVEAVECGYGPCTCHPQIAAFREAIR